MVKQHSKIRGTLPPLHPPRKAEFSGMVEIKEELLHTKNNRHMREATGASTINEFRRGHRSSTINEFPETRGSLTGGGIAV